MTYYCENCVENCPYKPLLQKLAGKFDENNVKASVSCSMMPDPLFTVNIGSMPYALEAKTMQVVWGKAGRTLDHDTILFNFMKEARGEVIGDRKIL